MRLHPLWFIRLNPLRGMNGMRNIQVNLQRPLGKDIGGCGDRIGSCAKNVTDLSHLNTLHANVWLCVRSTALIAVMLDCV